MHEDDGSEWAERLNHENERTIESSFSAAAEGEAGTLAWILALAAWSRPFGNDPMIAWLIRLAEKLDGPPCHRGERSKTRQ